MNYSEVFVLFEHQGWNDNTKLELLLRFLDMYADSILTPDMFKDYLCECVAEENSKREEMTIEEMIDALERTGDGCGLISDDAGRWAVSTSGMQNVADSLPQDISTLFFVTESEWKPTIREALQAYVAEL